MKARNLAQTCRRGPLALISLLFCWLACMNIRCSSDTPNRLSPKKTTDTQARPTSAAAEAAPTPVETNGNAPIVSLVVGVDISGSTGQLSKKRFNAATIQKIADLLAAKGKKLRLTYATIGTPNQQGVETPLEFEPYSTEDCGKQPTLFAQKKCETAKNNANAAAKNHNDAQAARFQQWCDALPTKGSTQHTDLNKFIQQAKIWLGNEQKSERKAIFMFTDGKQSTKTGTKLVCDLPPDVEVFTCLWDAAPQCPNAKKIGDNPELFEYVFLTKYQ